MGWQLSGLGHTGCEPPYRCRSAKGVAHPHLRSLCDPGTWGCAFKMLRKSVPGGLRTPFGSMLRSKVPGGG